MRSILMLLVLLVVAAPAAAQGLSPEATGEERAASAGAAQLGAPHYGGREEAMRRLWSERSESETEIRAAAASEDPEVAARARWILERWQRSITADLSPEVRRQLSQAGEDLGERIAAMLDGGHLAAALAIARPACEAPGARQPRFVVGKAISDRFVHLVRVAREEQLFDELRALLDLTADAVPLAVARAALLQSLGEPLDDALLLPACARHWSGSKRDAVAITALATLGYVDQAIERARQAGDFDRLAAVLLLDDRWPELAEEAAQYAALQRPGSAEATRAWSQALLAAEQAGMPQIADSAAEALAQGQHPRQEGEEAEPFDANASAVPPDATLRWGSLLVAGRFEPALAILRRADPPKAAEVLSVLGQHETAFEVLGLRRHHQADDLDALLQAAQRAATAPPPRREGQTNRRGAGRDNPALEALHAAARLLFLTGQPLTARRTLVRSAAVNDAEGNPQAARLTAMRAALRFGRFEWIGQLATSPEEEEIDRTLLFYLGSGLRISEPTLIFQIGEALQKSHEGLSGRERVEALVALARGELPEGWDRIGDLDALCEAFFAGDSMGPGRRFNARQARLRLQLGQPALPVTLGLGEFFAQLGRADLAERCFRHAVASGSPTTLAGYARRQLDAGQTAAAALLYERAYDQLRTLPRPEAGQRSPLRDDPPSALEPIAGLAVAAERQGRRGDAERSWELVDAVPFDPSIYTQAELAERLTGWGHPERARRLLEPVMRFSLLESVSEYDLYSTTLSYVALLDEDPELAARSLRRTLFAALDQVPLYAVAYLTLPARIEIAMAHAAMKQGNAESVREHLERSLTYAPLNIDLAEDLLPKLREQSMEEVADEVLDRIVAGGTDHLAAFPRDASMANNLAWVCAINGRHLEESLRWARTAVRLVPDSVSYRDTLAEVLYQSGRPEEAIAIEKQCLIDKPDEWHLHEQLEKFASDSGLTRRVRDPVTAPGRPSRE